MNSQERAEQIIAEWVDGRINGDDTSDDPREAFILYLAAALDAAVADAITDYWLRYYVTEHCTLCGNHGTIDTRGVRTPAGYPVGRVNYCICPNGQALRAGRAGGT